MKRLKSSRRQLPFRVLRRFAPFSKANLHLCVACFTWYTYMVPWTAQGSNWEKLGPAASRRLVRRVRMPFSSLKAVYISGQGYVDPDAQSGTLVPSLCEP
jgi:hypothetical protein